MAVIKVKNLTYHYPDSRNAALDRINLDIPEGQFVLVVGGSGSGKSALVRALAGLIPEFYGGAYAGGVYLDNKEISQLQRRELVQKIGLVFQDPESQLVMTNVEQELAFGLENLALPNNLIKRRVMEMASALNLTDRLNGSIPELSGGQKQKVALASVLAMQPEILLLDEPTSQLDPIAGEDLLTMVRRLNEENGLTVVLIEQRLERCFHLADRILVMDRGQIVYDHHDPEEVARWAVANHSRFIPPLARLFASVGYPGVPVTVKQGRALLRNNHLPEREAGRHPSSLPIPKKGVKAAIASQPLVDIKHVWFSYPDGEEVLKDVNFTIDPGEFIVLMGENGAGKTTLVKNINGLLKPSRGQLKVGNRNVRQLSVEEIAPIAAYLSQDPNDYLFLPSVREELAFTLNNLGLPDDGISEQLLKRLKLDSLADRNPRDLSTGERQRAALAAVLVSRPQLLMLDEPTRGLDYALKEELGAILQQLQSEGTAILVVTHDVEFAAEYAEKIVLMAQGSIIAEGDKYSMLSDSTFYCPQISKLFNNLVDGVVTLKQGQAVLTEIMAINNKQALSV